MKTAALDFEKRGRFEGMLNILRFNWPLYLRALAVAVSGVIFLSVFNFPILVKMLGACAVVVSIFCLATSLAVSHWIYDRSPLYSLSWLGRAVPFTPLHVVNLTAGFDETTLRLRAKYAEASVKALDFYDPRIHTEPSIGRARAFRPPPPETIRISSGRMNLLSESVDLALGILALHEIRQPQERTTIFRSISAALRPGGRCVVVEHLRDTPNFLAFGPGFLHFFSRNTWLEAAQVQTLHLVDEFSLTPFVRVFVLEKNDA